MTVGLQRTSRWPTRSLTRSTSGDSPTPTSHGPTHVGVRLPSVGFASAIGGPQWWIDGSVEVGLDAAGDVDLIYVWMQPYASADAGAVLSRRLGKPWVADLGDPWALDEMDVYPSALHRRLTLRHMEKMLGTASGIVMSTPEAVDRLLSALPRLASRPVVSIPNGFDAADFAAHGPPAETGGFRIVHTGYLHTELGELHRRRQSVRRGPGRQRLRSGHPHSLARVPDRRDQRSAAA